jgi:hypothetical protein
MSKILEWLKRILSAAIGGFVRSFGNPVAAEVSAVEEAGKIAVEEISHATHREEPKAFGQGSTEAAPEVESRSGQNTVGKTPHIPGPTTFDKAVDKPYGSNRKH